MLSLDVRYTFPSLVTAVSSNAGQPADGSAVNVRASTSKRYTTLSFPPAYESVTRLGSGAAGAGPTAGAEASGARVAPPESAGGVLVAGVGTAPTAPVPCTSMLHAPAPATQESAANVKARVRELGVVIERGPADERTGRAEASQLVIAPTTRPRGQSRTRIVMVREPRL